MQSPHQWKYLNILKYVFIKIRFLEITFIQIILTRFQRWIFKVGIVRCARSTREFEVSIVRFVRSSRDRSQTPITDIVIIFADKDEPFPPGPFLNLGNETVQVRYESDLVMNEWDLMGYAQTEWIMSKLDRVKCGISVRQGMDAVRQSEERELWRMAQ